MGVGTPILCSPHIVHPVTITAEAKHKKVYNLIYCKEDLLIELIIQ